MIATPMRYLELRSELGGSMLKLVACLLAFALLPAPAWSADDTAAESDAAQEEAVLAGLTRVHGSVTLPGANVTLKLGQRCYFLDAADARKVIVDAWDNPEDQAKGVLGMIFPTDKTPLDDGWGAVVTYSDDGYVPDKDARTIDYDELLRQMRDDEDAHDEELRKHGYLTGRLVGWAEPPSYDPARHSLVWAKDIQFGDQRDHILNYNVRILGRRGVLNLNVVSTMSRLAAVRPAAEALQGLAAFQPGSAYADHQPGTDKQAAYGLAGLVLGGAGLVAVQKAGLLAAGLLLLKKGAVLILGAGAAAAAWLRRRFGRAKP